MPEPPRRKRFQIHLSTAIVMMFVAGGLIWANVVERLEGNYIGLIQLSEEPYVTKGTEAEFLAMPQAAKGASWEGNRSLIRGWPCTGMTIRKPLYRESGGYTLYPKILAADPGVYGPEDVVIHKVGVAINVMVMTIVLFAACFLCEHLIRRRAARKAP